MANAFFEKIHTENKDFTYTSWVNRMKAPLSFHDQLLILLDYGEITSYGEYSLKAGPLVSEPSITLQMILSGNGIFHNRKGDFPVSSGDVILTRKSYVLRGCADTVLKRCHLKLFENRFASKLCFGGKSMAATMGKKEIFCLKNSDFLRRISGSLRDILEQERDSIFSELSSVIYLFLLELNRQSSSSWKLFPFNRLIPLIRRNPHLPYSIPMLSNICGMGEKTFSRFFRRKFGTSPMAMVAQIRMSVAAGALLILREKSIGEIAARVGYDSQSYFTREFTQWFGMTPTEFRDARPKLDTVYGKALSGKLKRKGVRGENGGSNAPLSNRRTRVLTLLEKQPDISIRGLARFLEITPPAVKKHLDFLVANGYISSSGTTHRKFRRELTTEGRLILKTSNLKNHTKS